MKKHTKVWLKSRGWWMIDEDEFILCEWCEMKGAVDVHHIDPRGMGGSKEKDTPENLIALCRSCHDRAESKEVEKERLQKRVQLILDK